MRLATWDGDAHGSNCSRSAAAPATCGVAIEVPLSVFVAVSEVNHAEVMPTPGAYRSRQLPKFENEAWASEASEAPTVRAAGRRPGDCVQASSAPLPAATAKVTPAAMALCTAWSRVAEAAPPRLRFATAGERWLAATQSIPDSADETDPAPVQSRTRTDQSRTPFATPWVEP